MKQKIFCVSVLAMACAFAATARSQAQEVASSVVTLDEVVREALARNPELKFYEAEIDVAKAGRKSAGLLANPELTATVGRDTSRDKSTGLGAEGVAWSVSIMQPFEWPGRMGLRKSIANRDIELAELGQARFRAALAGRARTVGYTLLCAQEKAAAAREVAARFAALREVLLQRDPAGLTPLLETRVIEASALTMEHKASEAELAAQAALLELNQLRGEPSGASWQVAREELSFRASEGLDTLVAMARTNNFELRVRAAELAQQGFRVTLARQERYPAISVGPTYTRGNPAENEQTIGVGVSLPLPLWNRNSANIESASARRMQAQTSLAVAGRDVERQVIEAALAYETKRREMARWPAEVVEHFRAAAELADRHYRLGAVPVNVYVELQKQYLEAVESLLDTKRDALATAQKLEALTGLTPPLASAGTPAPRP